MNRNFVITFLMLAVTILSACGGQSGAATVTPTVQNTTVAPTIGITTPSATFTAGPTITGEPSSTLVTQEMTATPAPTRPPNAPDCTNSAGFVADVTVPDNTEIQGGAIFTKTWRIMNTGTCIWAADYTLTPYSEERMNAPAAVPLDLTYPGQNLDISVELTAPNSIGTHRGNFVIKNPAGLIMKINDDSRLWLIISVKSTAAATAAPTTQATVATATSVTATTSGSVLANPTCAYSIDQTKLLEMLNAVNAYRSQQGGMFAYTVNPQLARAAQSHASDMACNQFTGDLGSNGSTVQARVAASGYTAKASEENLYSNNPPLSGQEVVNKWINDPTNTHPKLNLISDTFIEIGIGYASFNNTGYYVIVFATP